MKSMFIGIKAPGRERLLSDPQVQPWAQVTLHGRRMEGSNSLGLRHGVFQYASR